MYICLSLLFKLFTNHFGMSFKKLHCCVYAIKWQDVTPVSLPECLRLDTPTCVCCLADAILYPNVTGLAWCGKILNLQLNHV